MTRTGKLKRVVATAERGLLRAKARLTALRRKLPREAVTDYELLGPGGRRIRLSDLFGRKDDLIVIHNMGKACPYCTLWADGFNGLLPHLQDRAAFVVISGDTPAEQARFAKSRRWRLPMASSRGTSFARDMGYAAKDGSPLPGVSTFRRERRGGRSRLYRVANLPLGPGDDFCSLWHFFDLLQGGAGKWQPQYRY